MTLIESKNVQFSYFSETFWKIDGCKWGFVKIEGCNCTRCTYANRAPEILRLTSQEFSQGYGKKGKVGDRIASFYFVSK